MPHTVTPQPTPNPNALRFQLDSPALGAKSRSFANPDDANGVEWAERLFAIPGVVSLFGVNDFLTVTKERDAEWPAITPHVLDVLRNAEF